jgi:4-amino-4-deoxy-L-arabinose transferase-like glycosyltransferase
MAVAARYRLSLVAILIGAGALYLLGNERVPLLDRDEPRYAECSREMLRSGDWVVPRFLGEPRAHKPPLIYWCQAISMSVLGQTAAAARFPSAVSVTLTAILLALFVRRFAGRRRAVWTALVFCTSALTIAAAKLCITDGLLLPLICIGQGCLFILWNNHRTSWPAVLLLWITTALAGLTKGPVVLAMHAATMLVLAAMTVGSRRRNISAWKEAISWWRRTQPLVGVIILIAIVTPWLMLVNHRAPDFLPALLNRAGRYATGGAEGHAHLPGFYLLMIWGLFFPWSLMLPTSIGMGIRHRDDGLIRFALAAAIGPWLVMELVTNKLPFYILPSFPGLAILAAHAIVRCRDAAVESADADFKKREFLIGVAVWAIAVQVAAVIFLLPGNLLRWSPATEIVWCSICEIYLLTVTAAFARRRVALAGAAMGIGIMLLAAALFGAIIPNMTQLSASRRIGEELIALGAGGDTPVAMIDYREPSLAFYQGGGARESNIGVLSSSAPPQWAVITEEAWKALPPEIQSRYAVANSPQLALIYNDGQRFVHLLILRRKR